MLSRLCVSVALAAVIATLASACGGSTEQQVVQSPDRLQWASLFSNLSVSSDPKLVAQIEDAAEASGARPLDVSVVSTNRGKHVAVVTLQSDDPASYMKHNLLGFLRDIGVQTDHWEGFVELVDGDGRSVWSSGRGGKTGMVHVLPKFDSCSPIVHSRPAGVTYPPCPAD